MPLADAGRAVAPAVAGPAGEAEEGGPVVGIVAPLGDGRPAARPAEHGGGAQREHRRQGVDRAAAIARVGDRTEDVVEGTIGGLRTHGATPSPMSYKAMGARVLDL